MKNNKEFVPSPKRSKKAKSKKKGKGGSGLKFKLAGPERDAPMEVDEDEHLNKGKRKGGARFGSEVTNRLDEDRNQDMDSPLKRQRIVEGNEDEDWAPPAVSKKAKRKVQEIAAK